MTRLRIFWRSVFDIRKGEYLRTACMTLYLLLVLFAYYILKPVSRAIFLNKFDIDKLPWLYVLIAGVGGILAYFYTKLAVKSSLRTAVTAATIFSIGVLVGFWFLIQLNLGWVVYAFNIWVSLFSIILVSQGWLIAANIFTPREAKRIYGILGVGSVIGAAFGGSFTAFTVYYIGTTNLILACAGMVVLSYIPFLVLLSRMSVKLRSAKAAEDEEEFSFREMVGALTKYRHLQVIMAIMVFTFIIDVMVEFQFNAQAKLAYHNKTDLTAFLGTFYGFWLNMVTFIFQFFLTAWIVSRFGVGGTLQIMPASIALASIAALVAPNVLSTAAARLTEASTRYSFNKTGMELLYLPLPLELRNRTKAFIDVFVDRISRGIGGMILVVATTVFALQTQHIAIIVMCFAVAWIFLSLVAKREYIATVRRRLETRRLDFENARINMNDRATIALLEQAAVSDSPRQAAYAISMLANLEPHRIRTPLDKLVQSPAPAVRAASYELAIKEQNRAFVDAAMNEIRSSRDDSPAVSAAVRYALAFSEEPKELGKRFLEHPNAAVAEAALDALRDRNDVARELITHEWLTQAARDANAGRRRLAAIAVRARGDEGTEALHSLITDSDPGVASAAMASAAALNNREYLPSIVRRLPESKVRGVAIDSLAAYGNRIVGTLSDLLEDDSINIAIRRQIPRVLRLIPAQRSVQALTNFVCHANPVLRAAALRALNRLRDSAPDLDYSMIPVADHVMSEARNYFELSAALAVFRQHNQPHTPAGLLAATLEERLKGSLERLFRLLGLRYPQPQIYAAYQAVSRGRHDDMAAALEFLDNVLDKNLKRIVVPLLEDTDRVQQRGVDAFGIRPKDVETALRELINSGDEWLVACAMATAAQLRVRSLAPDIDTVSKNSGGEVYQVARDAALALA